MGFFHNSLAARIFLATAATAVLIAWLDGAIVINDVVAAFQAVFNEALHA